MGIFYLIFLTLVGCYGIKLRKDGVKVPFSSHETTLNIYHISYPKNLKDKQLFFLEIYNEFFDILEQKRRLTILIDDSFFKDMAEIEMGEMLEEEKFLEMPASELDEKNRETLLEYGGHSRDKKYKVKELLSIQIKHLLDMAGKGDQFDPKKSYMERDKEEMLNLIRAKRKNLSKIVKSSEGNLEFFSLIESPYSKDSKSVAPNSYYQKRVEKSAKESLNLTKPDVCKSVVVKNLSNKDEDKIADDRKKVDINNMVIWSSKYKGYRLMKGGNLIFFAAGDEVLNTFSKYSVEINIIEAELTDLGQLSSDILLADMMVS